MENTTDTHVKLRELLSEQRQLLTQFLLITQEQTKIIADEDEDALLHNLEQRQAIIRKVDDLQSEFTPLWQTHLINVDQEPAIVNLQEEIGIILREATAIDNKNQMVVRERIDFLGEQMRRLNNTRKGTEAYIKGTDTFFGGYVDECQ
ncbi:MAG: flagellar protein FlgN [Firmicutes bacterium]|nr:flagellar protein FlgN [Bacillota bacterium]